MRAALAAALLLAACGDSAATISGVVPAEGFTGRSLRVEVSGDATQWSGTPVVSFGDGVTISGVTIASPTALFIDLTVDADAVPGVRDVTVSNNGTYKLDQAFRVDSPIEVAFAGQLAQGGAPYFTITNHDFDTPFDLTMDAQGSYSNLAFATPPGVELQITAATPYQLKGFTVIDADAAAGPLSLTSGVAGSEVPFVLGADLPIKARTPAPLADMATGMLAAVGDSGFYSIELSQVPALVREVAAPSGMDARPVAYLLPGGKWQQAHPATRTIEPISGSYDVVVFDRGMAAGYSYTLKSHAEPLASAPEASDAGAGNATVATATVAGAIPFQQSSGTLETATDKDWIQVTLATSAVLHVVAIASDDTNDTKVDILNNTGTASVIGGPIDDGDCGFFSACGEDFVTPQALPAGTYFVEIAHGATTFSPANNMYTALVYLE